MEGKIYKAIADTMNDVAAVGKDSLNKNQGYRFRSIDAVMNALHPAMTKNRIFVVPEVLEQQREERQGKSGKLIYSICKIKYTFYADDGSSVSAIVIGEGMDSGDKATNKAMSIAFKYACFQVFCIPTEDIVDPDAETPEPSTPIRTITSEQIGDLKKEMMRTGITAETMLSTAQMRTYIKTMNPDVPTSVLDMIPYYLSEGEAEGIRGDLAFCQSCLETGNFTFEGSAVTLDQNNFCGMGVTSNGMKGNSFDTPQMGIRAQIQHLKAYANNDNLVNACIDPRFNYVQRGCAPYVEWLGIQENPSDRGWASGAGYGTKILEIYKKILLIKTATEETQPIKTFLVHVSIPDLRIRTGAGLKYPYVGYCPIGVYTIVDTVAADGYTWGKLKSGAGWIALEYTKNVE